MERTYYICIVIYNKYRLFFHYLFTPIDNKQMSQIDDSWVYYSEHDPYFQFDSNHIDYMPSIDKNEPFIMETTLQSLQRKRTKQSWIVFIDHRSTRTLCRQDVENRCFLALSKLCWSNTQSLFGDHQSNDQLHFFTIDPTSHRDDLGFRYRHRIVDLD